MTVMLRYYLPAWLKDEKETTDQASPKFVPPAERIAVFES
jgi:hypothetical protein